MLFQRFRRQSFLRVQAATSVNRCHPRVESVRTVRSTGCNRTSGVGRHTSVIPEAPGLSRGESSLYFPPVGAAARLAAPLLPRALTASRRLSARGTDRFHPGNDLTANEVEQVRIRYIGRVEDRLIDPHLGQVLAVLDR